MLAALPLGAGCGLLLHSTGSAGLVALVSEAGATLSGLFLRLVRMVVAPLVLATLAGGVAGTRGQDGLGRVALRAMAWFVCASIGSLSLGLIAADWLRPGAGMGLTTTQIAVMQPAMPDAATLLLDLVPTSLLDAMARNDIVQIVVFALLFGVAITRLPEPTASRLQTALSDLGQAMLALTTMLMRVAPIAVFAALLSAFARQGVSLAHGYLLFIGGFYATMLVLWGAMIAAGRLLIGPGIVTLLRMAAPPMLLGFATASSEAAFPALVAALERFGVRPGVVGLVLPLGYAFNLDGAMLFQAFAALFIAQAYGVPLDGWHQIGLLLVLLATSKGTAGVPRAAIVALAAAMPRFGLPDAGLLLVLGIDHLLDMGRTATNVLGNAIATVVAAGRTGDVDDGPKSCSAQNEAL